MPDIVSSPELPQESNTASNRSSLKNPIMLTAIIMLIVGISIILVVRNYKIFTPSKTLLTPSPSSEPTQTPTDLTQDWKTYTNNQLGFEIKYPSNWFISNNLQRSLGDQSFAMEITNVNPNNSGKSYPPNRVSLFINQELCPGNTDDFIRLPPPSHTLSKTTCLDPFTLTAQLPEDYLQKQEILVVLNSILSSFKFLESADKNMVNFSLCPENKTFNQLHGLGSNTLTILKSTSDSCEIEFTNEIEGGYSTYYCQVPKTENPIIFPATDPIKRYCKLKKSGNLLMETRY